MPRFYELERDGREWVASELLIIGTPTCLRITEGAGTDAALLRCSVPTARDGVIAVALHRGIRFAGLQLGSYRATSEPGGESDDRVMLTGPEFPTGGAELRLIDAAGTPRPPIVVPPYRP